ncbi:MAG: hypothetical protein QOH69_473 [Actinomycetota bacterium]|jgi:hypothetical protein|nr:hypothetical protein [Actinomycetota bacterium]
MSDAGERDDPVVNIAFSKTISWRVFNEHIYPEHMASRRSFTGTAIGGRQDYEVPRNQTVSLSASINGRQRFDVVGVTRAVLDSVTRQRTYDTKSRGYVARLVLWGALWALAFGLIWVALLSSIILGFVVLFAVIVVAPLFLSGAIIDFCWWAGRGFQSESRARWTIAVVLWALDVAPLVLLQIRVLP